MADLSAMKAGSKKMPRFLIQTSNNFMPSQKNNGSVLGLYVGGGAAEPSLKSAFLQDAQNK